MSDCRVNLFHKLVIRSNFCVSFSIRPFLTEILETVLERSNHKNVRYYIISLFRGQGILYDSGFQYFAEIFNSPNASVFARDQVAFYITMRTIFWRYSSEMIFELMYSPFYRAISENLLDGTVEGIENLVSEFNSSLVNTPAPYHIDVEGFRVSIDRELNFTLLNENGYILAPLSRAEQEKNESFASRLRAFNNLSFSVKSKILGSNDFRKISGKTLMFAVNKWSESSDSFTNCQDRKIEYTSLCVKALECHTFEQFIVVFEESQSFKFVVEYIRNFNLNFNREINVNADILIRFFVSMNINTMKAISLKSRLDSFINIVFNKLVPLDGYGTVVFARFLDRCFATMPHDQVVQFLNNNIPILRQCLNSGYYDLDFLMTAIENKQSFDACSQNAYEHATFLLDNGGRRSGYKQYFLKNMSWDHFCKLQLDSLPEVFSIVDSAFDEHSGIFVNDFEAGDLYKARIFELIIQNISLGNLTPLENSEDLLMAFCEKLPAKFLPIFAYINNKISEEPVLLKYFKQTENESSSEKKTSEEHNCDETPSLAVKDEPSFEIEMNEKDSCTKTSNLEFRNESLSEKKRDKKDDHTKTSNLELRNESSSEKKNGEEHNYDKTPRLAVKDEPSSEIKMNEKDSCTKTSNLEFRNESSFKNKTSEKDNCDKTLNLTVKNESSFDKSNNPNSVAKLTKHYQNFIDIQEEYNDKGLKPVVNFGLKEQELNNKNKHSNVLSSSDTKDQNLTFIKPCDNNEDFNKSDDNGDYVTTQHESDIVPNSSLPNSDFGSKDQESRNENKHSNDPLLYSNVTAQREPKVDLICPLSIQKLQTPTCGIFNKSVKAQCDFNTNSNSQSTNKSDNNDGGENAPELNVDEKLKVATTLDSPKEKNKNKHSIAITLLCRCYSFFHHYFIQIFNFINKNPSEGKENQHPKKSEKFPYNIGPSNLIDFHQTAAKHDNMISLQQ